MMILSLIDTKVIGDLIDQVRPEEAGIVLFVFGIWLAAIALFFNRCIFYFALYTASTLAKN